MKGERKKREVFTVHTVYSLCFVSTHFVTLRTDVLLVGVETPHVLADGVVVLKGFLAEVTSVVSVRVGMLRNVLLHRADVVKA